MAHHNKSQSKPSAKKVQAKRPPVYSPSKKEKNTLFSSLDKWVIDNSKMLLAIILGASILFSFLVFQARMDIGGDDSGYVLRAYDFIHKGIFPSFQGPLYPLFLSIFVSFSGINVILLKSLSVFANFISLLFLYKAFKNRIPAFVLYSVLLITAVNSYILTFASETYSEAFFMALQSIFLFYLFNLLDRLKKNNAITLKESWKNWLWVGLMAFLMSAARSVGIMTIGALVVYFAIQKQYKYILYAIGAFLVFYIPVNFIEKVVWHAQSQFGAQGSEYMLKNPYSVADGYENFNGFVLRFFQNCNLYLSKRFFQILGLRSFDATNTITGLTFMFVLAFLLSIYRVIKAKNQYLLASSVYALCLTGITFILLQVQWDQPRLIMVFVPLYLLLFVYGLQDILKRASWGLQFLTVFAIVIVMVIQFDNTLKKANQNLPVLSKNLHGDIYDGFSPGWANYLKLSNWCQNLPKDSLVACRKGPMSSVYANGREFLNIAKTDNIDINNADSVMAFFRKNHVRYIILANINMGNTIERLVAPIAQKYPQKLRVIKQEGSTDEAQLVELLY